MFMKTIAGAAVGIVMGVSGAIAATFSPIQFDAGASSISITPQVALGNIAIGAEFTPEASSAFPWTPTSATDVLDVGKFIKWTINSDFGATSFDVVASLVFTAPTLASGGASGSGRAGTISTFFGSVSAGKLVWDNGGAGSIDFGQYGDLDFVLAGTTPNFFSYTVGHGNMITTGATFTGNDLTPVPLPASALLLLAGVGGLGAMRRLQKK